MPQRLLSISCVNRVLTAAAAKDKNTPSRGAVSKFIPTFGAKRKATKLSSICATQDATEQKLEDSKVSISIEQELPCFMEDIPCLREESQNMPGTEPEEQMNCRSHVESVCHGDIDKTEEVAMDNEHNGPREESQMMTENEQQTVAEAVACAEDPLATLTASQWQQFNEVDDLAASVAFSKDPVMMKPDENEKIQEILQNLTSFNQMLLSYRQQVAVLKKQWSC
ncbi:hypothetical protein CAPTEDRAFT_186327 [Capitella teleta]|uniref:Uncharacterized protein n=1 Tax=Capitella teleta TaxID=283909 RepID=R7TQU0_CAPTE|nr:hypothetical protein CAPTEDRAFT_186327 [Capitella teleta]|eukprot:ELT93395.1 hypothetical protein CAPTEDRAFT_186327 [Capitella teleta]